MRSGFALATNAIIIFHYSHIIILLRERKRECDVCFKRGWGFIYLLLKYRKSCVNPGGGGGGLFVFKHERGAYFKSNIFQEIHLNFPNFTFSPSTKSRARYWLCITLSHATPFSPNSMILLEMKGQLSI